MSLFVCLNNSNNKDDISTEHGRDENGYKLDYAFLKKNTKMIISMKSGLLCLARTKNKHICYETVLQRLLCKLKILSRKCVCFLNYEVFQWYTLEQAIDKRMHDHGEFVP